MIRWPAPRISAPASTAAAAGAWGLTAKSCVAPTLFARRRLVGVQGLLLHIDGNGEMRHAFARKRCAAGQRHRRLDLGSAEDGSGMLRRVSEQSDMIDILLGAGLYQVMIGQAGDRQHRRPVELGVIKPVQQMDAARTRGREATPDFAGPFGVGAGHEGGALLMADLDKADTILAGPQRFHDAIDTVARQAEDEIHAPGDKFLDQEI